MPAMSSQPGGVDGQVADCPASTRGLSTGVVRWGSSKLECRMQNAASPFAFKQAAHCTCREYATAGMHIVLLDPVESTACLGHTPPYHFALKNLIRRMSWSGMNECLTPGSSHDPMRSSLGSAHLDGAYVRNS
jgi:hypothetical protein